MRASKRRLRTRFTLSSSRIHVCAINNTPIRSLRRTLLRAVGQESSFSDWAERSIHSSVRPSVTYEFTACVHVRLDVEQSMKVSGRLARRWRYSVVSVSFGCCCWGRLDQRTYIPPSASLLRRQCLQRLGWRSATDWVINSIRKTSVGWRSLHYYFGVYNVIWLRLIDGLRMAQFTNGVANRSYEYIPYYTELDTCYRHSCTS